MNKWIAFGIFLLLWLLIAWVIQRIWDSLADPPDEEDDDRFE